MNLPLWQRVQLLLPVVVVAPPRVPSQQPHRSENENIAVETVLQY